MPIPEDEVPAKRAGNVINLMDSLRKSIEGDKPKATKKPVASEKAPARKGIGLVKESKAAID